LLILLHLAQPLIIHKEILHAVALPLPDRTGRVRHDRPEPRMPLHQLFIDCILSGRTLSHHIINPTHLPSPRSFHSFLSPRYEARNPYTFSAAPPFPRRPSRPARSAGSPEDRYRHIPMPPFPRIPQWG